MVNFEDAKRKDEKRKSNNNYESWKRQIQTNVDYESLKMAYPYEHKLIDEIIEIRVEVVMSNGGCIKELNPVSEKAALNPDFVEWLMGFPIGWTDVNSGEKNLIYQN